MSPTEVYVVWAQERGYEPAEWAVAAYFSKELAEQHAKEATQLAQKLAKEYSDAQEANDYTGVDETLYKNYLDPHTLFPWNDTEYYVVTLKLLTQLPRKTS